jgi:hypothetical protein
MQETIGEPADYDTQHNEAHDAIQNMGNSNSTSTHQPTLRRSSSSRKVIAGRHFQNVAGTLLESRNLVQTKAETMYCTGKLKTDLPLTLCILSHSTNEDPKSAWKKSSSVSPNAPQPRKNGARAQSTEPRREDVGAKSKVE